MNLCTRSSSHLIPTLLSHRTASSIQGSLRSFPCHGRSASSTVSLETQRHVTSLCLSFFICQVTSSAEFTASQQVQLTLLWSPPSHSQVPGSARTTQKTKPSCRPHSFCVAPWKEPRLNPAKTQRAVSRPLGFQLASWHICLYT